LQAAAAVAVRRGGAYVAAGRAISACPGKACPCEGEGGCRFSEKDMRQRKKLEVP